MLESVTTSTRRNEAFTLPEEQIRNLEGAGGGTPFAEICRKHGVSDASIYKWKAKFGGMDVSDARKLKALEDENAS